MLLIHTVYGRKDDGTLSPVMDVVETIDRVEYDHIMQVMTVSHDSCCQKHMNISPNDWNLITRSIESISEGNVIDIRDIKPQKPPMWIRCRTCPDSDTCDYDYEPCRCGEKGDNND